MQIPSNNHSKIPDRKENSTPHLGSFTFCWPFLIWTSIKFQSRTGGHSQSVSQWLKTAQKWARMGSPAMGCWSAQSKALASRTIDWPGQLAVTERMFGGSKKLDEHRSGHQWRRQALGHLQKVATGRPFTDKTGTKVLLPAANGLGSPNGPVSMCLFVQKHLIEEDCCAPHFAVRIISKEI